MINDKEVHFAFFGSSRLSVIVLNELLKFDLKPSLIITTPDKPQGRKLEIKPNAVKEWAISHNVHVLDPIKLNSTFIEQLKHESNKNAQDLFIVASYGKIIPEEVIKIPKHKTLNIHPSLLPEYRGASPLPTAILEDKKNTGITIMRIDSEMDHGPIVAQKKIEILRWPTYEEFEEMMAITGAHILAEILPDWIKGKLMPIEQNHAKATYTKKMTKEDGWIDLSVSDLQHPENIPTNRAYEIFRKIQAYHEWPQAYFFIERNRQPKQSNTKIRIKITDASFEDNKLTINKVIPEGKNEMPYEDFLRGYLK